MIADRVRDEAIAVAKAYSHPMVEPRHVLWGIVHVLGEATPPEVTVASVKALLEPAGSAYKTPLVSPTAETILASITSEATAKTVCIDVAKRLGPGGDGFPPPGVAPGASGSGDAVAADAGDAGATGSGAAGAADAGATGSAAAGTTGSGDAGTAGSGDASGQPTGTAATATTSTEGSGTTPPATTTPGKETTAAILADLDALVGLAPVKAAVHRLVAVQLLNAERKAQGLPEVNASAHLVFTGSPGTGKTTIARIIARLYGSIGIVSRGQLIEVSRADLVAGYVGQTALKVQEVVDRAVGGVLFIDEAYALSFEGSGEYGAEAVAMLVKLMEDHRDDLAVIVAGYPDEMRQFINSNPGLRSRFTHYIDFPDYTADELVRVFQGFCAEAKVRLAVDCPARLEELFSSALKIGNFGNARYARSLFEQSYANVATRALADGKIDRSELDEIILEDLPPDDPFLTAGHKIGFQPR